MEAVVLKSTDVFQLPLWKSKKIICCHVAGSPQMRFVTAYTEIDPAIVAVAGGC